ncbi:leucine-rich repeat-containing protein 3-like [Boleophthalmus pectinirostris]|uniref:leucine-rich repeat-containing protein 3-like n=1 Tax=Boleophthalmus pectinirostris TaxID=150288 RepID=UPI000A1C4E59|nr:leucine-rich repeat-containing protein 3-like [Boleophthalmus pectinirostris]
MALVLVLLLWSSGAWAGSSSAVSVRVCQGSESPSGFFTLRCSSRALTQVPAAVPVHTVRLLLDRNLLRSVPPNAFAHLHRLETLDLSHNKLSSLDPGCFRGLSGSLRFLDLSSNQLSVLELASLGGLQARTNLTHNPWHCNCSTQEALPELQLDPLSLNDVICQSSNIPNLGAVGAPVLVLVQDWDLCESVRKQVDLVMLLTMGVWFLALVLFFFFYVHQNQVHAQRHLQYIKTMHMNPDMEPEPEPTQD